MSDKKQTGTGVYFGINAAGAPVAACWFGPAPDSPTEREARNFVRRGTKSIRKIYKNNPALQPMLDAFMNAAVQRAG